MLKNNKEESPLESIEHELYDPKNKVTATEIHTLPSSRKISLPTSWGNDDTLIIKKTEEKGVSFGSKLLLVSIIFLCLALSFTAWRVVSLRNVVSSSQIEIATEVVPFIEGGEATPFVVTVHNKNQAILNDATVTLSYKQGSSSLDEQEKIQEKRSLGNIASGEYKKQDFSVVLYGQEAERRDIIVKLEYKVEGSNAIFNKIYTSEVVLKTPPISVSIESPDTLSVGQIGSFRIMVRNNSATTSRQSIVQLTLPSSFIMTETQDPPLPRSTSWEIPSLQKGEAKTISIAGSFDGKEGEVVTMQAKLGSPDGSSKNLGIVYSSQTKDIRLRASPITLSMKMNANLGGAESIRYNDRARIDIEYKNTSLQALEDVSIVLYVEGEAPLYKSIDPTNGYYDSLAKTITWNKATLPDLAVLAPNAQGMVQVFIPIVDKGANTPKLQVKVVSSASSRAFNDVVATVSKIWAVEGSVSISAITRHRDAVLSNNGPIPPKANQETSYSVSLNISAQNELSSAKVSFTLPVYVSWRGVVSDNERMTYDSRTRTVTWTIGPMKEKELATGEVSLLVKPSQSHVGTSPSITSGIVLEAEEKQSRSRIKTTLSPLSTRIQGESWEIDPSKVVE